MNKKNDKLFLSSPNSRMEQILDFLSATGFGSVSQLAASLNVSEMTIRRDLDKLETEGKIRRTHGGAITEKRTQIELNFRSRQLRQSDQKDIIAKLAVDLIQPGQSIFMDAGTTILAMAKKLKMDQKPKNLRIITNSLAIQSEFMNEPLIEVITTGGKILPHTLSLVGPLAQENIASMRFDWAFLGTGGIDLQRGLTHSTMEEIPIKQAAADSAIKVVVLADHTKFGYNALSLFMPNDKVDVIVTDCYIDKANEILKTTSKKTKLLAPAS